MASKQPFIEDSNNRQNITFPASSIEMSDGTTAQAAVESLQQSAQENSTFKTSIENKYRKANTAYAKDSMSYAVELPAGFYLECTTEGTTGTGALVLPETTVDGTTFQDGTVSWTIRKAGSKVSFTSSLSSGTKIGTLTIDGTSIDLYSTNDTTYSTATTSNNGLMSAEDKKKLDTISFDSLGRIRIKTGVYGFRIDEKDPNPFTRVEYIYDAADMSPCAMDFMNGIFDYGSWENIWFVKNNKPLMLKSDGTVDYYLNPNDYALKEDGTASDITNTSYDGNAVASFPLIWVKRYQDSRYKYVLFCEEQFDSDFKVYAHTNANGIIRPYFYWGIFPGSGNATKIKSLSGILAIGQDTASVITEKNKLTVQEMVDGAVANGAGWYIHTWSQRSLITDMLVLLGKSTDTRSIFGSGYYSKRHGNYTGTLNKMGQFSDKGEGMKAFHVEDLYSNNSDRTAGLINDNGVIYVKMTPEGNGYRVADVTGYTYVGPTTPSGSTEDYIKAMNCSEYGMIPTLVNSSTDGGTTYYCDSYYADNDSLGYASAGNGGFSLSLSSEPTNIYGSCGLSFIQP